MSLGAERDPSAYELCEEHSLGLRVPLGWELQDLRPERSSGVQVSLLQQ